jgi:hypothetical protein
VAHGCIYLIDPRHNNKRKQCVVKAEGRKNNALVYLRQRVVVAIGSRNDASTRGSPERVGAWMGAKA